MSAAQKATSQSGKDREEKPKQTARKGKDYPVLGEQGGRFYERFRIAGTGDVPEQTHLDNVHQVQLHALGGGWVAVDDSHTVEATTVDEELGITQVDYSIPVKPNLTPGGERRAAEREKAEREKTAKKG